MFFLVGFARIKRFLCATKFDNCPHSQRYVYQFAWKPVFSRDNSSSIPFRESISTVRKTNVPASHILYFHRSTNARKWDCYAISTSSLKFETRRGEGEKKKYLTVFPLKNRKSANRRMQNILRENAFSHYLCYWNEPSIGLIDQESLLTAPSPRSWIYYYPTII